jgi:hypothetical protein
MAARRLRQPARPTRLKKQPRGANMTKDDLALAPDLVPHRRASGR